MREHLNLIKRILREEIEKKASGKDETPLRVPEMNGNGVDTAKKNKTFPSDPNTRDMNSRNKMRDEMEKLVKAIDDNVEVYWDDFNDLIVNSKDLKYIRISPRFEDSFVIEMMTRNEDRMWSVGQSWEQAKEFVKVNLKHLYNQPTAVEKARDKSWRNADPKSEDKDVPQIKTDQKGIPQKDKPKTLPHTNEPSLDKKNKEKNFNEKQVKNEDDYPNKPMKTVDEFKKQSEHKVSDPVKLRKRKPNTTLIKKL